MVDEISLRGVVYDRYKSIAALADHVGWTRQKATNIVNMLTEPSLEDVDKLAKALGLSFERTARFFLHSKSQVCDG